MILGPDVDDHIGGEILDVDKLTECVVGIVAREVVLAQEGPDAVPFLVASDQHVISCLHDVPIGTFIGEIVFHELFVHTFNDIVDSPVLRIDEQVVPGSV